MMKNTTLHILLSLFITSCGDNLIEEVKERYDDGKLKVVEYYKMEGDNQVLVRKNEYHKNEKLKSEFNYNNGILEIETYYSTNGVDIIMTNNNDNLTYEIKNLKLFLNGFWLIEDKHQIQFNNEKFMEITDRGNDTIDVIYSNELQSFTLMDFDEQNNQFEYFIKTINSFNDVITQIHDDKNQFISIQFIRDINTQSFRKNK